MKGKDKFCLLFNAGISVLLFQGIGDDKLVKNRFREQISSTEYFLLLNPQKKFHFLV